ncbi:MAG: calcium/sodium antiporter [Alphaproteobacteria bacterium]
MTPAFLILAGLVLLFLCGDLLVRGAVAIAYRLRISPLVIGLTVVALGTSAPELVVSIEALLAGTDDIAVGNVIGSNIANILLILGIAAILRPLAAPEGGIYRDAAMLILASIVLWVVSTKGAVAAWEGAGMLALLATYLVYAYWTEARGAAGGASLYVREAEESREDDRPLWRSLLYLAGSIIGLIVGGDLLVLGAIDLARTAGLSERVIGLTLVAVGTSLPELATCAAAALRRHGDVAVGTVIGSNIFNVLLVIGVVSLGGELTVAETFVRQDLWVMLGSVLVLLPFLVLRRPLGRAPGLAFLVAYAAYVGVQFVA